LPHGRMQFGRLLVLGSLVVLGLCYAGVLFLPELCIENLLGNLIADPSLTGCTEIWRFTLEHLSERPIVGFGFQTAAVRGGHGVIGRVNSRHLAILCS
jgi:O-antigen ligase